MCACQACQLGKLKKEENYSLVPTSEGAALETTNCNKKKKEGFLFNIVMKTDESM